MKAIFIKELRENLKWAALLFLLLMAGIIFALYAASGGRNSVYATGQFELPLLSTPMQAATVCGFWGSAVALGLLQSLQDHRRGRWAFVSHRPVSRSRMFFAKVLSGLMLYLAVTGVAFALAVVWVASPGHFPVPFEWHMALPGLTDILAGGTWYFAGLCVGTRPARWFGSRITPAGVALIGSAGALAAVIDDGGPAKVLLAVTLIGGAYAMLFLGAWSSFVRRGALERQAWHVRLLETLNVGTGVSMVFAAACGIGFSLMSLFVTPEPYNWSQYTISRGGQIRRLSSTPSQAMQVTDLQGNIIPGDPQEAADDSMSMASLIVAHQFGSGFRYPGAYVWQVAEANGVGWFYVVPRRTIEGYNRVTRQFTGTLGSAGIAAPGQPAQQYEAHTTAYMRQLMGPQGAYMVDDNPLRVRQFFVADAGDPVMSAGFINVYADKERGQYGAKPIGIYPVIATQKQLIVQKDGVDVFRIPRPPEFRWSVQVGTTDGKRFFFHFQQRQPYLEPDQVIETDAKGVVLARTTLPIQQINYHPYPAWMEFVQTLPIPPAIMVIAAAVGDPMPGRWPVSVLIMAALAAGAAWVITGRFAFGRSSRVTWTVLAALGGVCGVLVLLAVRTFPARLPCPHCGRRRPVDREHCPQCNASFEPPGLEGVEIFEAAATA